MKQTIIPIVLLSIEDDGFHLLVEVKINNKKANMLIDTGASRTVFDKNRIHHFIKHNKFEKNEKLSTGLGTNSMVSQNAMIEKMQLGKLVIVDYKAVLLDLSHVNTAYKQLKFKQVDGVIGGDILVPYKATIDYGKKKLKLML